jgi:hypothetical protein
MKLNVCVNAWDLELVLLITSAKKLSISGILSFLPRVTRSFVLE